MAPALGAPVVNLQLTVGLPALRAHALAPAQPDRHDHPLGAEADVDSGRSGQAEQPLECRGDAHVPLLEEPLTLDSQQPPAEGGGASTAFCTTSAKLLSRRRCCKPEPNAAFQAATSPTTRPETPKHPSAPINRRLQSAPAG